MSSLEALLIEAVHLCGAEAVFVNDKDGVLIARADAPNIAIDIDPWLATTFINALEQATKLQLGEALNMVSDFNNVSVVHYNMLPLIVTFCLKPNSNIGLVHAVFDRLQTRLEPNSLCRMMMTRRFQNSFTNMLAVLATSAIATMLGAFSEEHLVTKGTPLDDDPQKAFNEAIELLEDRLDGQSAEVVSYREQVIAGMHYLYKVKLGDGDRYMHLLVWRKPDQQVAVSHYDMGKDAADALEPFLSRSISSDNMNILY